jgi:hypothetical protein
MSAYDTRDKVLALGTIDAEIAEVNASHCLPKLAMLMLLLATQNYNNSCYRPVEDR